MEETKIDCIPNLRHSAEIGQIVAALVEALPALDSASKSAENPHFRSKYADLTSIMEVAKPALAKVGIAIMQPPSVFDQVNVLVSTMLLHKSGQWMACELALASRDSSPQAVGSAITYARRYGLSGLLGITAEDDDGNAASGVAAPRKEAPNKPVAVPPKPEAFKMREAFAGIKADLKKITGSDDAYYKILGGHGFEKSTQITDRSKGASIYGEMRAAFKDAMNAATTDKDHVTEADAEALAQ